MSDAKPTPTKGPAANSARGERPRRLRRGLRVMPLNKMIPNMLTLGALASGMTGMRFALHERWEAAAFAILIAAILDTLDGRVARLLKGSSKFGAELDSLSDFICFGVAPAMILYHWALEGAGRFGWFLVVLFAMCCAMRPEAYVGYLQNPYLVSVVLIVCGGLFVSTLPTFSFKNMKMARAWMMPLMIAVAVLAAFVVTDPWLALTAILVLYIASFPLSIRSYLWHKSRSTNSEAAPGTTAE